ncbi:MAG: hypothetical protein GTO46_00675, partial [Gemmatimonadetes bacterium]|nr:hypothetical protein [Gemmatimonadota bacterium]
DEQQVFISCVEDVLQSTPDLRYVLLLDPQEIALRDPAIYALFLIRTNPAHDIALAVELSDPAFVVRINGLSFIR